MQELIEKSKVMALARQLETHLVGYTPTELEPREFIKDDWQEYLVSSKDSVTTMHWNDYEQVWMKNKRIHVGDQSLFGDVIAWQDLPKPPLQ